MIRDGDVQIPYDPNRETKPSWSYYNYASTPAEPDLGARKGVQMVCECGRRYTLRSVDRRSDGTFGHDVDADGTVTPSIHCSPCCGWHVMGRLVGWQPV